MNKQSMKEAVAPFKHYKMSEMMPALKAAADHYGLKLSRPMHFRIALRYILHARKYN